MFDEDINKKIKDSQAPLPRKVSGTSPLLKAIKELVKKEFPENIEVNNFGEVKAHLRNELKILSTKLEKAFKTVKVSNPETKVSNLGELTSVLSDIKQSSRALLVLAESFRFNPEINVPDVVVPDIKIPDINIPEIKIPKINVPTPKVTVNTQAPDLGKLNKALDNLKYLSDRADKPLSVRMSDGKKFVKALKAVAKKSAEVAYAFSNSGGMTVDEYKLALGKTILMDSDGDELGINSDGSINVEVGGTVPLPTGASTEAKQLPNDHDVTVSNMIPAVETGLATSDNQTDGSQKTQIVDASGNVIDSHPDADGGYHLGTSIIQSIITSTKNSTTANLTSGNTFTGAADETFGVNGIQVFHASDQDCTIYIDQSIDDSFPSETTVTDSFICLADSPCSRTFISVAPYYRLRVKNDGASTTSTLATYTGMTPMINVLPRELSPQGNLQVVSSLRGDENYDRHVWVNPTNEIATSPVYRMEGTAFDGSTKDPNFWEDGSLRDGTVTQSGGEVQLDTNTTANGLALYQSLKKSRFVAGSAQLFSGGVNWVTAGTANNTRRVGAYTLDASLDVEDGFFFQLSGATFSIGYCRAGTPTLVNSGSFNGNKGVNFIPTANTYYKVAIEFAPMGAFWYIDGELLHKIGKIHASDTMTLPITIENENTGDSTTSVVFDTIGLYIARQGELYTNPTSKFLQGTGTTVCKYGAGTIKGIIVSGVVDDTVISFYDGTTTGDTLLWTSGGIQAKTDYQPIPIDMFGMPFSDGLTIAITVENCNVLVMYE